MLIIKDGIPGRKPPISRSLVPGNTPPTSRPAHIFHHHAALPASVLQRIDIRPGWFLCFPLFPLSSKSVYSPPFPLPRRPRSLASLFSGVSFSNGRISPRPCSACVAFFVGMNACRKKGGGRRLKRPGGGGARGAQAGTGEGGSEVCVRVCVGTGGARGHGDNEGWKGGRGRRSNNNGKEGRARDATRCRARAAPVARPPAAARRALSRSRETVPSPPPSARASARPPVRTLARSPVRPR